MGSTSELDSGSESSVQRGVRRPFLQRALASSPPVARLFEFEVSFVRAFEELFVLAMLDTPACRPGPLTAFAGNLSFSVMDVGLGLGWKDIDLRARSRASTVRSSKPGAAGFAVAADADCCSRDTGTPAYSVCTGTDWRVAFAFSFACAA